jgi:hypothetical protein
MPTNHQQAVDADASSLAGAVTLFAAITGRDPVELLDDRYQKDPQGFEGMVADHYRQSTGQDAPEGTSEAVYQAARSHLEG